MKRDRETECGGSDVTGAAVRRKLAAHINSSDRTFESKKGALVIPP